MINIHNTWMPYLKPVFGSPAMKALQESLKKEPYCPTDVDGKVRIFRVFEAPMDEIKVVIVGQDPYPNPDHACGLAFAVPEGVKVPYSLGVIIDEISLSVANDISLGLHESTPFDSTLTGWVNQGVFLLNRALTCSQGKPGSHTASWLGFTNYIVDCLAKQSSGIIWMLWGNDAKSLISTIENYDGNHILTHTHPAATRYGHSFTGCNHFKKANQILAEQNKPLIKWA